MSQSRDFPGPGEQVESTNIPGEVRTTPAPEGEMLPERQPHLGVKPIPQPESHLADAHDPASDARRTGTEHEGPRSPQTPEHLTEQRLDHSAHDLHRENAFDAVPDDAGPQSDKI